MRKALIGITPLLLSLAAIGQTAATHPAPAASAQSAAPTTAAQLAPPEHPLTDAQAHELMELTGTDKLKDQLVANATNYFKRSFPPYMPKDVMEDMTKSLEGADVNTPVVAIYKKYLSTEDAAKAIEFYKTEAGHDVVKASPQILGEAQRSAGQTAQQIAKEVIDRHKTEIDEAKVNYQKEHTPPTLGAPSSGTPPGTAPKTSTPPATAPSTTTPSTTAPPAKTTTPQG